MFLSPDAAVKAFSTRQFSPLYLFYGDEPYHLDQLTDLLEEIVLPPAERAFNQFVFFGKDLSVTSLIGYARRFPMMAERQLVIVKEAQGMLGMETKEAIRLFEEYLVNPVPSTVLVLCCKEMIDERKSWVKTFGKSGVVVISRRLYDNKLPDWIAGYCHTRGVKISKDALMMLSEHVGNDLKRLANELDKLLLNLRAGEAVTAELVETHVGVSREYNAFEFQKAIFLRDVAKANQIAAFFAANPRNYPLQPVLTVLYNYFSRILLTHAAPDHSEKALADLLSVNPYFVKDYLAGFQRFSPVKTAQVLSILRQADAQLKGVDVSSVDEGVILRDVIYNILH